MLNEATISFQWRHVFTACVNETELILHTMWCFHALHASFQVVFFLYRGIYRVVVKFFPSSWILFIKSVFFNYLSRASLEYSHRFGVWRTRFFKFFIQVPCIPTEGSQRFKKKLHSAWRKHSFKDYQMFTRWNFM